MQKAVKRAVRAAEQASQSDVEEAGLRVVLRVPLEVRPGEASVRYLRTNEQRMGYLRNRFDVHTGLSEEMKVSFTQPPNARSASSLRCR